MTGRSRDRTVRSCQNLVLVLVSCIAISSLLVAPITLRAQEASPGTETQTGQPADLPDSGPVPGDIGERNEPLGSKRVYDMANLLDNREEGKVGDDADRLARFGIPSLIITQSSDMPLDEATQFANTVRLEWRVESSPGADDGLVILVNVGEDAKRNVYSVMSWGAQALPHFGVDLLVSKEIQTEWLDTYLAEFDVYEGILFTLRRLIYLSIYEPALQPPLSDRQSTTQAIVEWAGPVLALGGLVVSLPGWTGWAARWRDRYRGAIPFIQSWALPILTFDLAIASIWSQSDIGVVCTLLLIVTMVITWIRGQAAQRVAHSSTAQSIHEGGVS